ncbi:hypothetical protein WME94_06060 [Sorangium sp. So ce429]
MRWAGCLLLMTSIASGCAAKVSHEPDSGAGTSSTGSGGAGAGAADAAEAGVEWTHDPGKTFSYVGCKDHGMVLFVEIWPTGAACTPEPFPLLDDVLVLVIAGWDGAPGTYTIGEQTAHGTAGATFAGPPEQLEGTITVEPFAEAPRWISWELSMAEGRTDLGLCGHFDDYPCATP